MSAPLAPRAPSRKLLWPGVATAIAFALLMSLGLWQMQRLAWKEALVAKMEARLTLPPTPLPARGDWPRLKPDDYEYLPVRVSGRFDHARETYVFRGSGQITGQLVQPGFQVFTPLMLPDGGAILVNRGFVPQANRDPATRAAGQIEGEITVSGLLRAPEDRNAFTPSDKPQDKLFYTRDPLAMSRAVGLTDAAPFSLDAAKSEVPGGLPQGGATIVSFPNNHLSYALTWFGLALTLLAVFAVFARRRRQA